MPTNGHRVILVVERDRSVSALVTDAIAVWCDDPTGYRCDVHRADSPASAASAFRAHSPDVVVAEASLALGSGDGFALLDSVRERALPPKVIVVAEGNDRERAAEAIGLGAFDYCVRPIDSHELAVLIRRALHIRDLEADVEDLPGRLAGVERFEDLVGSCEAMRAVFSDVQRVAMTDACVLLVGESGTGKRLISRAIHQLSPRRDARFVVVSSEGARPESMEEEIFGRLSDVRDDSGAVEPSRRGRLALADGGTLLLEGVCRLPEPLQARLAAHLREPGGGPDVRVVATTDREPRCGTSSSAGGPALREDLYYRLGVVTIGLPPLRDRGEDIAIMANAFLERYASEHGRSLAGFGRSAVAAMMSHEWPGNVAELEARVRRAAILSRGRLVGASDLGLNGNGRQPFLSLAEARNELERGMVSDALLQAAGNVSRAARSIGVSRPTMYDLIRKYELNLSEFKGLAGR